MKPYDHLIPATLHEQILAAKADLEDENISYTELLNSINQFIEDPSIDSCGIQALKRQFEDYLLVINAIITANSFDILEYGILDHKLEEIGFEELNGTAVIIRVKEVLLKEYCDKQAEYYRDKYKYDVVYSIDCDGNFFGISHNEEYLRKAEAYEEESRQHQKNIDECDRIIGLYDNVEAMTSELFQESVALRAQVTQALQSMGQSFVDGKYKAQLNQNWRATLADPKTQLLCYALLEQADITPEQIANMQEKGYSAQDILKLIRKFPDGADREFLNALMNKEYEKAFKIDPTTLSDGMFEVMTEYSMRMLHYDRHNSFVGQGDLQTEFEEFESFNNAILSSIEHCILPTSDPTDMHVETGKQYNEIYLEKMAGAAYELTLCQSDYISNMNPTGPGFFEAMEEHNRRNAALHLWSTEYLLAYKYRDDIGDDKVLLEMEIENLNFGVKSDGETTDGVITFDFKHCGSGTKMDTDVMSITTKETGDFLLGDQLLDLEEARLYYENAGNRMAQNIVAQTSNIALSFFSPEAVVALNLLEFVTTSDAKLHGLKNAFHSQTKKLTGMKKKLTSVGIAESCALVENVVNGLRDKKISLKNLDNLNDSTFFTVFADGAWAAAGANSDYLGTEHFICTCEILDPGMIYVFNRLQNEGMESLINFKINNDGQERTVEQVWNYIYEKKDTLTQPVLDDCEVLLFGSPEEFWDVVTGGDGELDGNDMEYFMDAIEEINKEGSPDTDVITQLTNTANAFDNGELDTN